jgi:hypothetical protein
MRKWKAADACDNAEIEALYVAVPYTTVARADVNAGKDIISSDIELCAKDTLHPDHDHPVPCCTTCIIITARNQQPLRRTRHPGRLTFFVPTMLQAPDILR